jgi:hypothetical protein
MDRGCQDVRNLFDANEIRDDSTDNNRREDITSTGDYVQSG